MIRASVDEAERLNDWVWRDSGKRPDFTAFLSDRNNVALIEGEGGALFVWRGPGTYEVHVFFEQRGKDVLALSHRMLDWMRVNQDAKRFWAAIPDESRRVKMFTRLMGWKLRECRTFPHGRCEVYEGN